MLVAIFGLFCMLILIWRVLRVMWKKVDRYSHDKLSSFAVKCDVVVLCCGVVDKENSLLDNALKR